MAVRVDIPGRQHTAVPGLGPKVDGPYDRCRMRFCRIGPRTYRRVTLAAALSLAAITVTGGAVRLTGSGLGCPNWPTCEEGRIVAPLEYHAMVEFVNRMVTGAVSAAVIVAVAGSLLRTPRRADLVRLSLGLVAGMVGQIVLGGLVVLFHLSPLLVMGHFVVSMLLVWCAVVLHHRAGIPDGAAAAPVLDSSLMPLRRLVPAACSLVLLLGTVVTGSGPHPGSHDGQVVERLPFAIRDVARLHAGAVWLFLALVVTAAVLLVRARAPRHLLRRAELLAAAIVAQGTLGYVQYFAGVPALLVGFHIAGAVAVWWAALTLSLGFYDTVPEPVPDRDPTLARI
ncbi:MAG: cytochrome oxidase assembly protein [Acidimicrobiia bacterium]